MGIFSKFEGKMEDTFEGTADKMFDAPISPVQIAKKAEKQMRREKMVGAGKQYAPTLYTVLVNPDDDRRLFGYYPTLAGETETYLAAKASEQGLMMDGQPLVRFIVDEGLKHGKFDVIAEAVAAPIIAQLRNEEMQRYGLANNGYGAEAAYPAQQFGRSAAAMAPEQHFEQAPYEQPHYNQYEQPYDQGYQQPAAQQAAPASNGWEPQGYQPAPAPMSQPDFAAAPMAGTAAAGAAAGYAVAQAAPQPQAFPQAAPQQYGAPQPAAAANTVVFAGNPADLQQPHQAAGSLDRHGREPRVRPGQRPRFARPRIAQHHHHPRHQRVAQPCRNHVEPAGHVDHYRPWLHEWHVRQRPRHRKPAAQRGRPHLRRHHRPCVHPGITEKRRTPRD